MSKHKLTVAIELDPGPARRANRELVDDTKATNRRLLSEAEARERAEAELIKRRNAEAIRASLDALDVSKRAAREEAEARQQAARDAAETARAAARDAAETARAAARAEAEARKQAARAAADEEKKAARATADARKQAAREAADAARAAARAGHDNAAAFDAQTASAFKFLDVFKGFAGQMIGLQSLEGVVRLFADDFKNLEKSIYNSAEFVKDYRRSLQELAALKGMFGTEALKSDVEFRAKTLQTAEGARSFQLSALSVGESAVDTARDKRLMSREEYERGLALAGSFQAYEGGDPLAHGTLYGITPTLMAGATKRRVSGAEAFQREMQYFKILQPGGFPTFASGAQQLSRLSPLISTGLYEDRQAAALLSMFSTSNAEGAGEMVRQFTRATLGGIGRTGAPRMEDAGRWNDYLKSIGVDKKFVAQTKTTDLPFAIANRISEDLARQTTAAETRGVSFNPYTYLKQRGEGNDDDVKTLLEYYGARQKGRVDTFMKLAQETEAPDIGAIQRDVKDRQRTDPEMQRRQAELMEDLQKVTVGTKEQYRVNLMRATYSQLKVQEPEKYTEEFSEDLMNRWGTDPREIFFDRRRHMEEEAMSFLRQQAYKTGMTTEQIEDIDKSHRGIWGLNNQEYMYDLAKRVSARKGKIIPDLEDMKKRAGAALEEQAGFEGRGPRALPEVAMGRGLEQDVTSSVVSGAFGATQIPGVGVPAALAEIARNTRPQALPPPPVPRPVVPAPRVQDR